MVMRLYAYAHISHSHYDARDVSALDTQHQYAKAQLHVMTAQTPNTQTKVNLAKTHKDA